MPESLTSCQTNRTRLQVRTVRRDTAGPDMESLTSYQFNSTRLGVRIVRRDTAGLDSIKLHSQTVKPTPSDWE